MRTNTPNVRRNDFATNRPRLRMLAPDWPEETREAFAKVERTVAEQRIAEAFPEVSQSCNFLALAPGFQRSSLEIDPGSTVAGKSLQSFLRLHAVKHVPAPP